MRTAVFLGLIFIGDAINNKSFSVIYDGDSRVTTFMASLLIVFVVMDGIDFLQNTLRR